MLELGPASNDEMVLCFIRAEIDSPKWGPLYQRKLKDLHFDRSSLIDNADLGDRLANRDRGVILGAVRGYGHNIALFRKFPLDTRWRRVSVHPSDFYRLKYINCDEFWRDVTGGTRLVQDGAERYRGSERAAGVDAVLEKICQGASIPELILVEDMRGGLTILEGHTRATAFVAASKPAPALVGTSSAMHEWCFL
jgi:hypothetical protein